MDTKFEKLVELINKEPGLLTYKSHYKELKKAFEEFLPDFNELLANHASLLEIFNKITTEQIPSAAPASVPAQVMYKKRKKE
jgi:hypothetical protein